MKKVMMLHSVNHNMYGKRDPEQYGTITLDEINDLIEKTAKEEGIIVDNFQTNVLLVCISHKYIIQTKRLVYKIIFKSLRKGTAAE